MSKSLNLMFSKLEFFEKCTFISLPLCETNRNEVRDRPFDVLTVFRFFIKLFCANLIAKDYYSLQNIVFVSKCVYIIQ